MANIFKTELEKLGFKETAKPVKFPFRYKVLHIPTATYLMCYDVFTNNITTVSVKTRAKAGNIIETYRLGKLNDNITYFLEENIANEKNDRNFKWRIGSILMLARRENQINPLGKNEFEIIEEPYVDPSLDTSNSCPKK